MAYQVFFTGPAELDINNISDYLADILHAPGALDNLLEEMRRRLEDLEQSPYKYALSSDPQLARLGIRKIPVKNYLIFYQVDEPAQAVAIVRILYGRRDWARLLLDET